MCHFNILALIYYQEGKKTQVCYDVIAVSREHRYTKSDTQGSLQRQRATKWNMMLERESCCSAGPETARRAALNAVSRRRVMTPSLQNFGKSKWNLWMHCYIFLVRCMQSWEQFHMDFLTSPGAFVVEEDAVHSKEIVGLSEVHHNPVGIQFCCPYKNNFEVLRISALLVHSSDRHTYTCLTGRLKSTFQQRSALEFDSFPICVTFHMEKISSPINSSWMEKYCFSVQPLNWPGSIRALSHLFSYAHSSVALFLLQYN